MFARMIRRLLAPRGPLPAPTPHPAAPPPANPTACRVEVAAHGGMVWLRLIDPGKACGLTPGDALDLARELKAAALDGHGLGDVYRRLVAQAGAG